MFFKEFLLTFKKMMMIKTIAPQLQAFFVVFKLKFAIVFTKHQLSSFLKSQ